MTMIVSEGWRVVAKCSRMFSMTSVQRNMAREGKFMSKLLSATVERKIRDAPKATNTFKLLDKKRSAVLSNLYMQNITEILSFGGLSELADKEIQITNVVVKNAGIVEVFWNANENEDFVEVQEILNSIAGKVRNQLIHGAMMGNVPIIVFKRDLSFIQMNDTLQQIHKVSLELQAMEKNSKPEDTLLESEPKEDIAPAAPFMRMDTLGLPHDKIYKRIKEAKKNSYPLQVPVPPTPEEFNEMIQGKPGSHTESPQAQIQRKKELQKFIRLYKKSALNSSSRKNNLEDKSNHTFYYDETEDETEDDFEDHRR